jgi:hypothetical protein
MCELAPLNWSRIVLTLLFVLGGSGAGADPAPGSPASVTVICYLNGDNELTHEVLTAVDRMETVGSDKDFNVLALVDGHSDGVGRYGRQWSRTRLLRITRDGMLGSIGSEILAELGEKDLGRPETLQNFVETVLVRYPAHRYVFFAFTHGHGVIDTDPLDLSVTAKTLAFSDDKTDRSRMPLHALKGALSEALDGERFDIMVLFSCLANMVEIGYSLSGVTDYLIASEDLIRLPKQPSASRLLYRIPFERMLERLKADPSLPVEAPGKILIDDFIAPYLDTVPADAAPDNRANLLPASMAMVDCRRYSVLVSCLDQMAGLLIERLQNPCTAHVLLMKLQHSMKQSQNYHSFLNLEYYDLKDWLINLRKATDDTRIIALCDEIIVALDRHVIVHARHTPDCRSNGISIFFGNYFVPDNIYQRHRSLYSQTLFGKHTRWLEMIDVYRKAMLRWYPEILIQKCAALYERKADPFELQAAHSRIASALKRQIRTSPYNSVDIYLGFLESLDDRDLLPPAVRKHVAAIQRLSVPQRITE